MFVLCIFYTASVLLHFLNMRAKMVFIHHGLIWFGWYFLISMKKIQYNTNIQIQIYTPNSTRGYIKTCDRGKTSEFIFAAVKKKKKKKRFYIKVELAVAL